MKKIVSLIFVSLAFFLAKAQQPVSSLSLGVTTNKTTVLLFPFQILHVDRGTRDLLIQQVNPAKNVLLVKAGISDFQPTNLTVLTEDGAVYPFNVHYDNSPANTVFRFPPQSVNPAYDASGKKINIQDLDLYSKMILNNRRTSNGMKDTRYEMRGRVKGIFIKNNVIFFQLCFKNNSAINYSPESIRFYVRDKKKTKRTASQEVELKPISGNSIQDIPADQMKTLVFAFEKFTIPEAKFLYIEITEKKGGRYLRLKVTNNKIFKAQTLPDLFN
jgi:conjugative transposon TraN protein